MKMFCSRFRFVLAAVVAVSFANGPACFAHFLWLKTIHEDGKPQAFLFFGENTQDEAYHLPEPLAKAKVWRRADDGKRAELATKPLDTDERIGMTADLDGYAPCVLEASQAYGIYGKSLLTYYVKHVHADSPVTLNAIGQSKDLNLDIVPRLDGGKLQLTVLWQGKPVEGSEITVAAGDGKPAELKSDAEGHVELDAPAGGLVSVLANYRDKEAKGEFDGKNYEGAMHFASLTFNMPKSGEPAASKTSGVDPNASVLALPEPLTSFGAAVADGWLYIYSGHIGGEHEHSAANLSKHFRRIKIDGGAEWEELPMQMPLQGLAIVSHGGKVYRVGGLNARNATKEDDEDLHSTADFAEFDPAKNEWKALAPLPVPRSSHNAVVIGNKLYVVGGWHLHGESPGDWQQDALVYDFQKPEAGWQKLPEPPFQRRALAVGNWNGKLVAVGGMDENAEVSRRSDVFDPESGKWSKGPELPGKGMAGFGSAACGLNGELYVSEMQGVLYRLNDAGSAWDEATRMATGRFFHQLVPTASGGLLAVGGASMKDHLADIEWIDVKQNGRRL